MTELSSQFHEDSLFFPLIYSFIWEGRGMVCIEVRVDIVGSLL